MNSITAPEKGLKLGVTLYSLTNEFHGREYDFEQLVRKVASLGIGPGLEVVGFQSIKGFPHISHEFAANFRQLIEETGLTPSCLAINADVAINPAKPMTTEESVAYHERQIDAAVKLGFPVARFQYSAGPDVIRRLAPYAEKRNVKLGMEIHAPHFVTHPDVLAFREMYQQVGSPYLGFIPDFGSSARRIPPSLIDYFHSQDIPQRLIDLGLEIWSSEEGTGHDRRDKFQSTARAAGAQEFWIRELSIMFSLFSRQEPTAWREIMPQVIHIHGKFFDFDDKGEELVVDYASLLPVFVEGGFNGFMSSEWEGHHFQDASGLDKVVRHHAWCKKILGRAA